MTLFVATKVKTEHWLQSLLFCYVLSTFQIWKRGTFFSVDHQDNAIFSWEFNSVLSSSGNGSGRRGYCLQRASKVKLNKFSWCIIYTYIQRPFSCTWYSINIWYLRLLPAEKRRDRCLPGLDCLNNSLISAPSSVRNTNNPAPKKHVKLSTLQEKE